MRANEFITESSGVRLKDLATVKTNFPDADFWLQRKGSEKSVGTPTKEFSPENIGIKVTATDVLDARYLYYMMQHIHNIGYWKQFASGALRLVNLPLQHVANLPLGMNESLNEDENVQIKTDLTYTDSYQGQADGFILASANGKSPWADEGNGYCPNAVGGLDFSIYEGKALIKMVQVKPEYQRMGIGLALVKRLEQEVGKGNIDWGMMTDTGKVLHDKYQNLDEALPTWAKKGEFIIESIGPDTIFNQVKKIHHTFRDIEEGDLPDRIYWFSEYKKSELPLSLLYLHEFFVDEQLVDDYVKLIQSSPNTMPPIVYDPIAGSIIDGNHRANAYAKLGYDTIPAYVGLTKSDSYGERENEIDEAFPSWAKKGALAAGGAAALAAGGVALRHAQDDKPQVRFELPNAKSAENALRQDAKILAHTMWGEARDQGIDGMIAIGNVINNRAKDTKHARMFGQGIKNIATKHKQFSCWNPNDPNFKYAKEMEKIDHIVNTKRAPNNEDFNKWLSEFKNTGEFLDYKKWRKSLELATKILSGQLPDPTHGAVYYHTKNVHPEWAKSMKKIGSLGQHVFYSLPTAIKETHELDEYKVDNENGLGQVPYNANVDYMGLRVLMKPSIFLKLAHKLENPRSVDHIVNHIKQGGALGSPFLSIDIPREWEEGDFKHDARVSGHEGRNRMMAIQQVEGDDPVEVHLFPRGGMRARHLTSEIIKHLQDSMFGQDGNYVCGNLFQLMQK